VQLPLRPGRESASSRPGPGDPRGDVEVLQDEGGLTPGGHPDDELAEEMEPLTDPTAFPAVFPTPEQSTDPSVVGLLLPEPPSPSKVPVLDRRDLGERDNYGGGGARRGQHPVQGALVRVQ